MRARGGRGRGGSAAAAEVTLAGQEGTGAGCDPRQAQAQTRGFPGVRRDGGALGLSQHGCGGGSRDLPEVAAVSKANNPRAGGRALLPHSGREARARRPLVQACVPAQGRVSPTPLSALSPGRPGRPWAQWGCLRGRPEGGACREWLGQDPGNFDCSQVSRPLVGFVPQCPQHVVEIMVSACIYFKCFIPEGLLGHLCTRTHMQFQGLQKTGNRE